MNDSAERIPANLVGAEHMGFIWCFAHCPEIGLERVQRGNDWGGDSHNDDRNRQHAPERCHGRAPGEFAHALPHPR